MKSYLDKNFGSQNWKCSLAMLWMGAGEGMRASRKNKGIVWFEMEDIIYVTIPSESESIPVHAGIHAAHVRPKGPD